MDLVSTQSGFDVSLAEHREQVRLETLSEVGRRLIAEAVKLREQPVRREERANAFWDAGCYVVEQLGDGDWRGRGDDGRNEFIQDRA